MRRGPRLSQSEGGPHAHAVGAPVVPKRRRPPRPRGGGPSGPKAKEAPTPMRLGAPVSRSEGGPLAHALGASVPMRWGPQWSQSEGGSLYHVVGSSVVPKRSRPTRPCDGGLGGPKAKKARTPM